MSAASALCEAADLIGRAQRIAVLSHVNPDADAIGSALGLTRGLQAIGKDAVTLLSDPVPEYARFLSGSETIGSSFPEVAPELYIFADAAGIDRVGTLYSDDPGRFEGIPLINIDHHRTNPMFGTVNYVVGDASSTSELSYRLLRALEAPIDAATASTLLFGIVGDTGSFRNGATTPGSLETAARLIELGADTQLVAFRLFESKTFAAARLWGRVVGGIELDRGRKIVFAYMSQAMLRAEGATVDEAEGIAEYLRGVQEAEVVMLLKETETGEMRISMRSRPNVDVSVVATGLGGGGHRQAAGCTIAGPYDRAKVTLIETYDSFHQR